MKYKLYILLCLHLIYNSVFSQEYNVQIYNSIRGLVSSGIVSIAFEDKTNKLWVSTRSDGVYSFNGKIYQKYKVEQEQKGIYSSHVIKDYKGQIWYINYAIPHIYFATLNQFKKNKIDTIVNNDCDFFQTKKIDVIYLKNDPYILHHCENKIYLYHIKSKKRSEIKVSGTLINIHIHNENIYYSTETGIYKLNANLESNIVISYPNIESFVFDSLNPSHLWGFSKGHILKFENQILKQSIVVTKKTDYEQIKINFINKSLYVYSNNFTYRYENNQLKPLMEKNGLLNDGTNSIVSDLEGNIWLCQKSGLIKLSNINIITYKGKDANLVENEFSVVKTIDKNRKLVGGGYLFSIIDKNFKVLETVNFKGENYSIYNRILDASIGNKSSIYINYYNGQAVYKNEKLKVLINGDKQGFFSSISTTKYYISCKNNELTFYDLNTDNIIYQTVLNCSMIRKMFVKNKNEIILCTSSSLESFDIEKKILKTKLINESVYSYCFDSINQIEYVGTYNGLFKIIKSKIEKINLDSQVHVYAISIDKNNRIWLGSNNGIYILDKNMKLLNHLSYLNGLKGNEINRSAFEFDEENNLWVGTNDGLNIISANIQKSEFIPSVNFESIIVNQKRLNTFPTVFNYSENNITFNFEFNSFINESLNSYSYILNGYDIEWSPYSITDFAQYKNLEPGIYTLKVKARNANKDISNILVYQFEILSPWWKKWWFYALCSLLVILIIIGIIKWQLMVLNKKQLQNQKIAESELKALRSQINPHYLSNSLLSLQNLILTDNKEQAFEVIGQYGKVMRNILNNSENQFIPLETEIESLRQYMELEGMLNFKDYDFSIVNNIDNHIYSKILVPSMLIQPFIENAILHGLSKKNTDPKVLKLIFNFDQTLQCEIVDNGVGRDATKKVNKSKKSMGISNVNSRMDLYGKLLKMQAKFEIIDLKDINNKPLGTKVALTLPYKLKVSDV